MDVFREVGEAPTETSIVDDIDSEICHSEDGWLTLKFSRFYLVYRDYLWRLWVSFSTKVAFFIGSFGFNFPNPWFFQSSCLATRTTVCSCLPVRFVLFFFFFSHWVEVVPVVVGNRFFRDYDGLRSFNVLTCIPNFNVESLASVKSSFFVVKSRPLPIAQHQKIIHSKHPAVFVRVRDRVLKIVL